MTRTAVSHQARTASPWLTAAILATLCGYLASATHAKELDDPQRPGRVEGVVKIGGKPTPATDVQLIKNDPMPSQRKGSIQEHRTKTDHRGRFVFENVPPGEWRVGLFKKFEQRIGTIRSPGFTLSHAIPFALAPGQTVTVQIGGTGRPVVGQVVPPQDSGLELEYQGGSFRRVWLVTDRTSPPKDLSEDDRQAWYKKYYRSEKGLAEWRSHRSYVADVESDGQFRIDDVPPGDYTGQIEVAKKGEDFGKASGRATLKFTVPPIEGLRTDEPLDLGQIVVKFPPPPKLAVGDVAPAFEVQTLDGKPLRLADFKGKVVLLDFWATWCGPCKAETPNLKDVWNQFGKDPRFAMIGLSYDQTPDAPRKYADKNKLGWIQAFAKGGFNSDVGKAYDVRGIPTILLIAPDGKIAAMKLRGKRIAKAVESILADKPK
ncbi:MAG: redoxin domain-containing protein [Phycisphaerae bacterium]|nr:redoxin domain-containing protein [Phycisphaerae bacterium]